jgi:hypothetical protein
MDGLSGCERIASTRYAVTKGHTIMTTPPLTPEQKHILLHLIVLRFMARTFIRSQNLNRQTIGILESAHLEAIQCGDTEGEALSKIRLDRAKETGLELKFQIIQVGKDFIGASSFYDQLPREVWLRALSVNESEWNSPDMLKYGDTIRNVVAVLSLENSATKNDATVHKPLNWCCTMGMMHVSHTNPALGKVLHDGANEVLGGVFGEYVPPTMLEQMGAA